MAAGGTSSPSLPSSSTRSSSSCGSGTTRSRRCTSSTTESCRRQSGGASSSLQVRRQGVGIGVRAGSELPSKTNRVYTRCHQRVSFDRLALNCQNHVGYPDKKVIKHSDIRSTHCAKTSPAKHCSMIKLFIYNFTTALFFGPQQQISLGHHPFSSDL